jgi:predicted GNAT family N-acyltransferase
MGLGRILFQWLEEYLYRNNGKITIAFNGQAYLKDFYESLGYTTDGKIVMDAGIKHYHFERTIDKLPASCFLPNEE